MRTNISTWRAPTEDDIIATISVAELNSYRNSANWEADPVDILCKRGAALVRDALRTNGNVEMSPSPYEIPESCISAAMDYVCFDVIKRIGGAVTEERRLARKHAEEFFMQIARGEFTPIGYNTYETEISGGAGAEVVRSSRLRLTPEKMEGL